ncbi:Tyrosine-protein kinase receptor Tie-1 [Holothuria leucospilota]|uniref:Tyrosine-protein kinase receptor Tie-1 n=1 Tax=Holothuria leucospilota TaxID=206669 RepID=A0A9Q1CMK6_HOLLE|nr:Tyrosine-protein kinase receptor Tie-1 [Holothuria leucospilota]
MSLLESILVLGILCGTAHSATITLSAMASPVTEGADMIVQCAIGGMEARDVAVALVVDTSSTAENGYDADFVEFYRCVIPQGLTSGTVNIPTFADTVTETTPDTLVVTGTPESGADMVSGTASFVITDDGMGSAPTIRVRTDFYGAVEVDGNIQLIVELIDGNGDVVPIEDADTIGFVFTDETAIGGTGAAGDDYDNTATAGLFGSMMGVATVETMISIPLFDDIVPENMEYFEIFLDPAGPSTLAVDAVTRHRLFIEDDDKPEIFLLNSDSVLPRRSRRTVTQYAFTVNANDGITWESGPYLLSDSIESDIGVAGANGIELNILRPSSRTRKRFNWFSYSTTETTPAGDFPLFTTTFISATGRRGRALINVLTGPTITVCPASLTVGETNLGNEETIFVMGGPGSRTLRWSVYRDPATRIERRLPEYNGKTSVTISTMSDIGVYKVFRRNRGPRGWVQYVNVIPSECPCGMYHDAGICDGGPLECLHGGFVDPSFSQGLCTCPPGYAGQTCEIPLAPGHFGSNGQYSISDFFPGKTNGGGITFSFGYPFGSRCAPGFYGPGCWKKCPDGTFGPGCDWDCNCVDNVCEPNGECPNGCAFGFTGSTCQIAM